jgi:flagellar hook-associated protein 2
MKPDLLSSLNKSGSGLNLRDLAQTLASAETAPRLVRLQRAQDSDAVRLSALTQVRSQVDMLGATLVRAATNPVLSIETSTIALAPKVTDRSALTKGSVTLDVLQMARPQVLEFAGFTSVSQPLAAGTISIDFGSWDGPEFSASPDRDRLTLTLAPGTTLQELAETLNSLSGITAQLLDKGDGTFSLGVLTETGATNAVRMTAQDSGTGGASLDVFDTTTTNAARQVQSAEDARVLVNGIALSRPTNTISDVLPGVDVTLGGLTSGIVQVDRNANVARDNLQTLIGGLNDTLGLLRDLTRSGVGGGTAGELAGDRNLQTLESSLRRLIAQPIAGFSDRPITLADLGVVSERNGSLRLDPPAFDRAFAANAAHFDALFDNKLRALSGRAEVSGTPSAALAAGDFAFARDPAGRATLDGFAMSSFALPDGRMRYTVLDGPARGISLTAAADLNSDTIRFGRSFAEGLAIVLDQAMSSNGVIGRREDEITRQNSQRGERIEQLEARAALIEKRYLSRFAAMEQVVSQMNSQSSYLKNLVDMWSQKR